MATENNSSSPVDIYYLIVLIIQFIFCLSGLLMNSFLAVVIHKKKNLHTTCGRLLLTLAIYDALAEFSTIHVSTFLILFNITIPLIYCFIVATWAGFFLLCTNFLIFFISFDRLLAVLMPVWYKYFINIEKYAKFYVASIAFITILLSSHNPILEWIYTISLKPDSQVYCLATDFVELGKPANVYGSLALIVTMCCTLVIYVTVWMILLFKNAENLQSVAERKMHKSLFILMGIILFCWILPYAAQMLVLPALQNTPKMSLFVNRLLMLSSKFAQSINAPVLYMSSSEYRKAMQKCVRLRAFTNSRSS